MNCMLLDNTVFVSDNSPPAQPSNDWHKRAMYHGYAFEHFSTSTSKDVHVNNSIQWATVNKLRIGNHKILTAGEVDCARASTDIDTYEPLQKDYIELKTSMQIHTQQHQDRFDKKLLKFYFQSYLLGVPKIIVGFKDKHGTLVDLKEYDTLSLPSLVRGSNYEWNPKSCTSLADILIQFITDTIRNIGDDSKLYKVHYSARDRAVSIVVTNLDDLTYATPDPHKRYGFMPEYLHVRMREQVGRK